MSAKKLVGSCLVVGVLHAAVLLLIADTLGYSIGASTYSPLGIGWRYIGLGLIATVPAWLFGRYRLVTPLVAVLIVTGTVIGMEFTPPGPTFRDVAELEQLDQPTGIMVVENGLYIVTYMRNAAVWTVGFLFLGLIEYTARTSWEWLSPPVSSTGWLAIPASRRSAAITATAGGAAHMIVMVWLAVRLGVSLSGGSTGAFYAYGAVGMWVLAAIPLYLLVRHRLIAPAALLTGFIFLDVAADFRATVEDPHALYFGGWFVYLALLGVAGAVESGLRRSSLIDRTAFRQESE